MSHRHIFCCAIILSFLAIPLSMPSHTIPRAQPLGDWRSESLAYLSSRQALNDLAAFRQFVQRAWAPAQNASDAQWITVGGSYSGALSAWFRLKYPHVRAPHFRSGNTVF